MKLKQKQQLLEYYSRDVQPPPKTTPNKNLKTPNKLYQNSSMKKLNPSLGKPPQTMLSQDKLQSVQIIDQNDSKEDQKSKNQIATAKSPNARHFHFNEDDVQIHFNQQNIIQDNHDNEYMQMTQKSNGSSGSSSGVSKFYQSNQVVANHNNNNNCFSQDNNFRKQRQLSEVQTKSSKPQSAMKISKQLSTKYIKQSKIEDKDELIGMIDMSLDDYEHNQSNTDTLENQNIVMINKPVLQSNTFEYYNQSKEQKMFEKTNYFQSRNLIAERLSNADVNTTQKIVYSGNNNSFLSDNQSKDCQILPLQTIDNNQLILNSPRNQIQEMPIYTKRIFSPSNLLKQQSIKQTSDMNKKYIQDNQTQNKKFQIEILEQNLNKKQNEYQQENQTTMQNQKSSNRNTNNFNTAYSIKDQQTERVTLGPSFKCEDTRYQLLNNKNYQASIIKQSEIQTQGDLLQPNHLKSQLNEEINVLINSRNIEKDSKLQQKYKLVEESHHTSSMFAERIDRINDLQFEEKITRENLFQKKKSQALIEYDTNQYRSERVNGVSNGNFTARLNGMSSSESQSDLITLHNYSLKNLSQSGLYIFDLNLRLANLKVIQSQMFTTNKLLRNIDLRNNKITQLPASICELLQLQKLRLDYNYLTELPDQIGNLCKLEFLSASQNKIVKLPDSLLSGNCPLNILIINDNKLVKLSENVNNLTSLQILLLHQNQLVEIPINLGDLYDLQELSLDWLIYLNQNQAINKHQKGDSGKIIILEFQQFLKTFKTTCEINRTQLDQIHFFHFLMYYHKIQELHDIQNIKFTSKNRTIFHQMALNGQFYLFNGILQSFSEVFFDINKLDADDSTPFILAIRNKRKDFVKALLQLPQTNINRPSSKYGHPLHLAIKTHEFKLALQLLKGFQLSHHRHLDVNCSSEDGNNSLHYLFSNFYIKPDICTEIARQLIKKGININLKNKNGFSPLHIAIIGGQHAALQFVIQHNKEQRKQGNQHQVFNFNLTGGKLNQNCLYLAIQQNNLKVISTMLFSEEQLNFMALDDEGRLCKDICPYNSPVYKMLTQYELKLYNRGFNQVQTQTTAKTNSITNQEQIIQYYYNKRHYQSPYKIRIKILEAAQNDKNRKNRKMNSQSFQRGKSVAATNKNNQHNTKTSEGLFTENKFQNQHSRVMSLNQRSSLEGIKLQEDKDSSYHNDYEFSRSHIERKSPFSRKSINYSYNSFISKQQKPKLTPLIQKEVSIDQFYNDDNMAQNYNLDQINEINKDILVISPNKSHLAKTVIINNISDNLYKSNQDHQLINLINNNQLLHCSQQKNQHHQPNLQQLQFNSDKNELTRRVKIEDVDDDANVQDDEVQDNQDFQKPQFNTFTKTPSQKQFITCIEGTNNVDTLILTKNIMEQVSLWKIKSQDFNNRSMSPKSHIQLAGVQTIPTQELLNYTTQQYNANEQLQMLSDDQHFSDQSHIYQVLEESILGIQPLIDNQKHQKLAIGLLQKSTMKHNKNQLLNQNNSIYQIYQEFYYNFALKKDTFLVEMIKQIQQQSCKIISIDFIYAIGNILTTQEMKSLIINYQTSTFNEKTITKRYNELAIYEMINWYSLKVYDQKHKTSVILKNENIKVSLVDQIYMTKKQQSEFNTVRNSIKQSPSKNQIGQQLRINLNSYENFNPSSLILQQQNNFSSLISQGTQQLNNKTTTQIIDIKQIMNHRQSLEGNYELQLILKQQNQLLINQKGAKLLQQVKQPLKEREKQYIESLQQSLQLKQQSSHTPSSNTTISALSKKDSVSLFQQSYQHLLQNGALNTQRYQLTESTTTAANKQLRVQHKKKLTQPTTIQTLMKSPTIQSKNSSSKLLKTQNISCKKNGGQLQNVSKQRKQSSNSLMKYQQTNTNTPSSMKQNQSKQLENRFQLKDKQKLGKIIDNSLLQQVVNGGVNSNKKPKINQPMSQSRNSSNQIFLTEDSINQLTQRINTNHFEDELTPYENSKFQMSEPLRRKQINPALRQSNLQIQVFNNGDEIESMQDQLRLKDKWEVLKENHTQKMDKIQESAIKRKNMFNSHTIKHQQKMISSNQSLERQYHNQEYQQQQEQQQQSFERSSIAYLNQRYKQIFRNTDINNMYQQQQQQTVVQHKRMQKIKK